MSEIDSKFEEDNLRNLTISSFKRINENLYLINYQNNYYLNDIINEGVKNQDQIRKFVNKKLKSISFGYFMHIIFIKILYNFCNIFLQ